MASHCRSGGRLRTRDDVGSREAAAQSRERCDTERYCRAWHDELSLRRPVARNVVLEQASRLERQTIALHLWQRSALDSLIASHCSQSLRFNGEPQFSQNAASDEFGRSQERHCCKDITKIIGSPGYRER